MSIPPISQEVLAQISGRGRLMEQLGHWPTFEDFEVLSLTLERALVSAAVNDLRVTFLVFDLDKAPDSPERRQGTAEILFESISALRIDGFAHQNPIMGLSIAEVEPHGQPNCFQVEWCGPDGKHEVSFTCVRISVLRVLDLNPFHKPNPRL